MSTWQGFQTYFSSLKKNNLSCNVWDVGLYHTKSSADLKHQPAIQKNVNYYNIRKLNIKQFGELKFLTIRSWIQSLEVTSNP